MKNARCLGEPIELFFPVRENAAEYAHAREMCLACPVRQTCLDFALETGTDSGMFGGMTPRERRGWRLGQIANIEHGGYHGDSPGTERGYYREKRAGQIPCQECRKGFNRAVYARAKARKEARASA